MAPHLSDDEVARHWDANADRWTEHVRRGRDVFREQLNNPAFLALIGDVRGKTVLAGCGEGYFSVTHPCFMTRGFDWLRDDAGNAVRLLVSGYFDREPWVERWKFERAPEETAPFAIPVFPRTLSDYVNALVAAGFSLREMREPRPSEEACREHPFLRPWRDHAALCLHLHATKGAG